MTTAAIRVAFSQTAGGGFTFTLVLDGPTLAPEIRFFCDESWPSLADAKIAARVVCAALGLRMIVVKEET